MCNHHAHLECKMDAETKAIHERRNAIQVLAAGGMLTVAGGSLAGCATNPETGEKQFIGLASEAQLNSMALSSWNEMKIAAVMGHEVGHVSGRHARERVSQQMAGQLAIGAGTIVGGSQMAKKCNTYKSAAQAARTARNQEAYNQSVAAYNRCMQGAQRNTQLLSQALGLGFTFGVILPYSRKHELQSDLLGAKYMHKAGYDANQAVRLWEKMAEASPSRQPEFMSTHPDPDKRAAKLRDYIAYQERLGSQGWESIAMPKAS